MDTIQIPDWLQPALAVEELEEFPRTGSELELERLAYEAVFERMIEAMIEGQSAKRVVQSDPRGIRFGKFFQWVQRDKGRLKRYEEAQRCSAEIFIEDAQEIADGDPNLPPEDIQRSKLRVEIRMKRSQFYNRDRYGDKQTVNINNKTVISMKNLLEKREQKLAQLEQLPIEGEFVTC